MPSYIGVFLEACYTCTVLTYTGGVTTPKSSAIYCVIGFRVRGDDRRVDGGDITGVDGGAITGVDGGG